MLTLVATPIGNLEDISPRALTALRQADAILCEDTRHSRILLSHYAIQKPLLSYHKFNEKKELDKILSILESGQRLALISDAGTPAISDPGHALVTACIKRGIPLTAIPGPCSPIQALLLSGFATTRFQCLGFLPKSPRKTLLQALFYPGTTLAFESPHRLLATLQILHTLVPNRPLAIARELTKHFEECRRGAASELLAHYATHPPKGEIILAIAEGPSPEDPLPLEELIPLLQQSHALSLKEAIKLAARLTHVPKKQLYKHFQNFKTCAILPSLTN